MEILRNTLSLIVLASAIGTWYFIKKHPNTKYRNISIVVAVISTVIFGVFFNESSENTTIVTQTTAQTAPSSITSSEPPASSTVDTSASEKAAREAEIKASSEVQDAALQSFATYFSEQLDALAATNGFNVHFTVTADHSRVTVIIPNENAYLGKAELQEIADNLLDTKNVAFRQWDSQEGNDLPWTPRLHLKIERGQVIASETTFGGEMKLKVKND